MSNYKDESESIKEIAKYSVTKKYERYQIKSIMINMIKTLLKKDTRTLTITDGTAGTGSDIVNFSSFFKEVNGVEINKEMFKILEKNIKDNKVYNVNLINSDYTNIWTLLKQDIIYLDPPWGGPDYKNNKYTYLFISSIPIETFISELLKSNENLLVFLKAPLNVNLTYYKKYANIYKSNGTDSFYLFLYYNLKKKSKRFCVKF